MKNNSFDLSPMGACYREAKAMLALGFIEYRIIFQPRECNKPAHVLAGLGASGNHGLEHVWLDVVPDIVSSAMSGDSAGLS